jgi:hypothetical protein
MGLLSPLQVSADVKAWQNPRASIFSFSKACIVVIVRGMFNHLRD